MTTYLNDILKLFPYNDEINLDVRIETSEKPDAKINRRTYLATPNDLLEGLNATFLMSSVDSIWMEDEILHVHSVLKC